MLLQVERPTIFTEYIKSGVISDLVQRNRQFSLLNKYFILLALSTGMEYLHSQKVIHGALKPDNILINQNNFPAICDFLEILNSNDNNNIQTNSKTYFNTKIYQFPEVLSGKLPTAKSDVKVEAFAKAHSIKLILIGKEFGTQKVEELKTLFNVKYEPGAFETVSLNESGKEISRLKLIIAKENA